MFPPPVRGWKVQSWRGRKPTRVSPACVGMKGSGPWAQGRSDRFPRTRGDEKPGPPTASMKAWFPPHARGWKEGLVEPRQGVHVLPACAGMEGTFTSRDSSKSGFPAYAGMKGIRPCISDHPERFPRMRGDGRGENDVDQDAQVIPPRVRGWKASEQTPHAKLLVSPAHAGMKGRALGTHCNCGRFPRARGDGRPRKSVQVAGTPFPPHTRGWKEVSRSAVSDVRVSPALAGDGRCPHRPIFQAGLCHPAPSTRFTDRYTSSSPDCV